MQTNDLLKCLRADIKRELKEEVMAEVKPIIQKQLYANIFTFREAMAYLKVSDSTLRRMVKEKDVPSFKQRECIYFRQIDLDKHIADAVKRDSGRSG